VPRYLGNLPRSGRPFAGLRVVYTVDSGFTGIEKLALPITTRVVERAR
jgi:hypothetical protein